MLVRTMIASAFTTLAMVMSACGGADQAVSQHQASTSTSALSEGDRSVLVELETLSREGDEPALVAHAADNFEVLDKIGNLPAGSPERQRLVAVAKTHPKAIDKANELWEDEKASADGELRRGTVYYRRSYW